MLSFNIIYNLEVVVACLKNFHGVGIGQLSKILALKSNQLIKLLLILQGSKETIQMQRKNNSAYLSLEPARYD